MPNIQAAIKHLRQTKKRTARNNKVRAGLDITIRYARKAVAGGKDVSTHVKAAIKALDKAAQKGVIKAGNAARKKSRLMKLVNKSSKK